MRMFFAVLILSAQAAHAENINVLLQVQEHLENRYSLTNFMTATVDDMRDKFSETVKLTTSTYRDCTDAYRNLERFASMSGKSKVVVDYGACGNFALDRIGDLGLSVVAIVKSVGTSPTGALKDNVVLFGLPYLDFADRSGRLLDSGDLRSAKVPVTGYCHDWKPRQDTPFSICISDPSVDDPLAEKLASSIGRWPDFRQLYAATATQAALNKLRTGNAAAHGNPYLFPAGRMTPSGNPNVLSPEGRLRINMDHPVMADWENSAYSGGINRLLEGLGINPVLDSSGDVCGSKCPKACNGNCTKQGDQQCCKGDGMPAPQSLWERVGDQ